MPAGASRPESQAQCGLRSPEQLLLEAKSRPLKDHRQMIQMRTVLEGSPIAVDLVGTKPCLPMTIMSTNARKSISR